jgi:hypothetical protein
MTIIPTSSPEPIDNQNEPWTIEYTVDKLAVCLAEVKENVVAATSNNNCKEIPARKYYLQARELSRWIPIAKPTPAFIICISDLTPQLKTEIVQLIRSPDNLRYVLTQAVGRIFENLDFEYYHLSIARNLRVRIEK